jgi:hypothetical protein
VHCISGHAAIKLTQARVPPSSDGRATDQVVAMTLQLEWVRGRYAVCRLDPATEGPAWTRNCPGLLCITRTDRELSIVAREECVPADVRAERDWVALRVAGPLDFTLVGVLSSLSGALARAAIPLFALSTFETDYLLVKSQHARAAVIALATVADVSRL